MKEFALNGFGPDLDPMSMGYMAPVSGGWDHTTHGIKVQRILLTYAETAATISGKASHGLVHILNTDIGTTHIGTISSPKLYRLTNSFGGTIADASRVSGAYDSGTTGWSIEGYGNTILATNGIDVVQTRDGTGTSAFIDSAAPNIPLANILCTWGPVGAQSVMAVGLGASAPGEVQNSGLGGPAGDWDDTAEGGYSADLTIGSLKAAQAYRSDIIVWSYDQMLLGTYDPTFVVTWSQIATDIGCIGRDAHCVLNNVVYFADRRCQLWQFDGSYPRKMSLPIQDYLREFRSHTAQNMILVADRQTQTVRVVLRDATFGVVRILSIHLPTGRVGWRSTLPNWVESGFDDPTDGSRSGGALGDEFWYVGNGPITTGKLAVLQETHTLPEPTEPLVFRTNPIGDHERASSITQVQARFVQPRRNVADTATAIEPALFGVTHFFGSDSDNMDGSSADSRTAKPWRCDVRGNAAWHELKVTITATTGANDAELAALAYNSDARDAGRGQS